MWWSRSTSSARPSCWASAGPPAPRRVRRRQPRRPRRRRRRPRPRKPAPRRPEPRRRPPRRAGRRRRPPAPRGLRRPNRSEMPARGRLIALEGIDGCGKSTQARALADVLAARLTFEPGATPVGARLRELLLAPDGAPPSLRAEALLMAADRAEHVARLLEPALAGGEWVVSDRYAGSTIAYQGYGQGLDPAALDELVRWATDGLAADLSILVDVSVDVAAGRLAAAGRSGAD